MPTRFLIIAASTLWLCQTNFALHYEHDDSDPDEIYAIEILADMILRLNRAPLTPLPMRVPMRLALGELHNPCQSTTPHLRGLSPAATAILRSWLQKNVEHPYPTEDIKQQLIQTTGLTLVQINNWFSNARRRCLKKIRENSARRQDFLWEKEPAIDAKSSDASTDNASEKEGL